MTRKGTIFSGFLNKKSHKGGENIAHEAPLEKDAVIIDSRTVADRRAEEMAEKNRISHPPSPEKVEIGGPKGLEPTRYGDWEKAGRCFDF